MKISKKIIGLLIVTAYFFVVLVPALNSYDGIGPQWLYLSGINAAALCALILNKEKNTEIITYFKAPTTLAFATFILLALLSISYATNRNIVIQDLGRQLNSFIVYLILGIFLLKYRITLKQIAWVVVVFLSIETYESLQPLIYELTRVGLQVFEAKSIDLSLFQGYAGNKNITAAAVMIKIPFLIYIIHVTKKIGVKVLGTILLIMSLLLIFILSARTSFVSLGFIILLTFIVLVIYGVKKSLIKQNIATIGFILISLIGSFALANKIIPSERNQVTKRIETIKLNAESSNGRFKLWENAISYIGEHPILGCGLGNWKVESTPYWSTEGDNYLVPYHAHNDFLEFTTELGITGGLAYVAIYVCLLLALLYVLQNGNYQQQQESFILGLALMVYVIDAFFNFPHERPIMQVPMALIFALITVTYLKVKENDTQ